MPNKKKKLFNKSNSVKYLLLPGNPEARNADGESLPSILVPVSKGYKQGSSLLLSNIELLCDPSEQNVSSKEPNLEKIMEGLEDASDSDDPGDSDDPESNSFALQMSNINFSSQTKRNHVVESVEYEKDTDDQSYCSDVSNQFSDADEFEQMQTKYLLTSVTPNCPESIKTFNERFEKAFEEYDDDQIGALDGEEICGHLTSESDRVKDLLYPDENEKEILTFGNYDDNIKEQILQYAEQDEVENLVKIVTEAPTEFNCKSILSTYSNKYNHPTIIKAEYNIKKIKVLANPLKKRLTSVQLKHLDKECKEENSESEESNDNYSVATSYNVRPKGETPEQKRERKKLFREAKRESRSFKKENKLAFKTERKLQTAQAIISRQYKGRKLL